MIKPTRILALVLGTALAGGALNAQSMNGVFVSDAGGETAASMWNDPSFIRSFTGSYGFLAGYEPRISDEEKEALRNLIDLIQASPLIAIQQIEAQIKPETSAAFDFILANLHFQEGNLVKAEQSYRNAIGKHPDFRRAFKNLGLVHVQAGNFAAAIPTISKALELGEVDGRAYGLLGYAYLTQQRYFPAESAYRQAIILQPDVTDWKIGLARCLLETQRHLDAIALFDTLLLTEPDNSEYWLLQSNAFIGNKQPLQAAKNIEVVRRMGKANLSTLTLLGDIYMNVDSPNLALDAYRAGIAEAGEGETGPLLRAAGILTSSGSFAEAKTMIDATRLHFADRLPEEDNLRLLTLEAKIARAEGDDETAVASLHKIVERDALNGEALIELANYFADQGDLARATNRYEQAQRIQAHERPALIAQAQALVRVANYTQALPLLRRALALRQDGNLESFTQRVERAARYQE